VDHTHEPHAQMAVGTVKRHKFVTAIILAIIVALFLVYVALSLYQSSGTRQLDLSRPGYDSARKEATKDSQVFAGFPSDGPINANSLKQFDELYKQKASEALIPLDAFSGDSLSDKTLQLQ